MALRVVRFDDPGWRDPSLAIPAEIGNVVQEKYEPPGGLQLLGYEPETKEKIVASAGFRRVSAEVCEEGNVVVFWGYQGRGIGRAMMAALLEEAKKAGYAGMRAEAPESIPTLVSF